MNLAHEIGENKCSIYSQDISQKSSSFLRLNLILNNLVHSIPNAIQGNTIKDPYHKENNKIKLFDFIVSNPPFKTDFSNYRNDLETKRIDLVFLQVFQKSLLKIKKDGNFSIIYTTYNKFSFKEW